ncbi:alpha/beta hydrolase [Dermacoccus sp. 147Ba]|uniref:alpha/beta hydrolase n=1 Tax=unclassified Dermacoccus TaxID=2643059 RepID=UPI0006420532|nr:MULTISPECIES: alpha/beta hydrolase fold domain-containing protein [unclassified Dermacoccus]KLO61788.1 hypothetical protein AA983_14140 [Dermacoccus sp. PE3]RYI20615.1 alpha/beta hydrolase [Dermacoccus sp. 147Ba]
MDRATLPDQQPSVGDPSLDREYSPSTMAKDMAATLQHYRRVGDLVRTRRQVHERIRYGASDAEICHIFPSGSGATAPTLVFVHGGHWQESSIDDACFAADDSLRAGFSYVAVGYGLAPTRSLEEMIDSVARSLRYVLADGHRFGIGGGRIHVAGSSAGAHLLAAALTRSDVPRVSTAHLMSGLYDLADIPRTYVNDAVGLTEDAAAAASPTRMAAPACDDVHLSVGRFETQTYLRQQERYATHLRTLNVPVRTEIVDNHDHFTLPLARFDGSTSVGRAAFAAMRRADAAAAPIGGSHL